MSENRYRFVIIHCLWVKRKFVPNFLGVLDVNISFNGGDTQRKERWEVKEERYRDMKSLELKRLINSKAKWRGYTLRN